MGFEASILFKEQSFIDLDVVDLLEDNDLDEGGSMPLFRIFSLFFNVRFVERPR